MVKIIGGLLHKRRLKKIRGRQMVIEINKAIHVAADIIASDAAHSITEGAVSSKNHVPSKPGEPPNADTHMLDRSIAVSVTAPMKAEINVFAPYAAALEFGTSKVAERPYMLRWSRLPGQVCGKIKLKPMSSCREFGHQIMGGMPPMI